MSMLALWKVTELYTLMIYACFPLFNAQIFKKFWYFQAQWKRQEHTELEDDWKLQGEKE